MSDLLDKAQEIEQQNREYAISKALSNKEKANVVNGDVLCLDCYAMVPPLRVEKVNAVRCIGCQVLHEIKQKQMGG